MRKAFALFIALLAFSSGIFLAFHYPLGRIVPIFLFAVLSIFAFYRVYIASSFVLVAMPVIGFAPWTGWVTFEEFDLLVLAIASGANFRTVLDKPHTSLSSSVPICKLGLAKLLIVIFGLSVNLALVRGIADAGGFDWGWYQGYFEPMNSVRLAKSFCWALVLLPIWLGANQKNTESERLLLPASMAIALGLASLAAVWERLAFPGLLNFSEDYRTTALFWEMHVGGAAFDGFLALSVPFAVWMLLRSNTERSLVLYGSILALAGYAALTTFSRGVYLAIPVGLAIMAIFAFRKPHADKRSLITRSGIWVALGLVIYFGLAASVVFPTSGYRGMLALLISTVLFQPVSVIFGYVSQKDAGRIFGLAGLVAISASISGSLLPKGAYWVFVAGVIGTIFGLMFRDEVKANGKLLIIFSGYLSVLIGCILIAVHWGGLGAGASMVWIVPVMLLALPVSRVCVVPKLSWRWHISLVSVMLLTALAIATFNGGAYMGNRFSASSQDIDARIRHWRTGLGQLEGLDWWLGRGLGRFPSMYFFSAPLSEHPGGYRLENSGDKYWLSLSGGEHINGWGEIFRVSQRISPGVAPYKVSFEALAEKPVQLHFEVCEKHLLYNAACIVQKISVEAMPTVWQKLNCDLQGAAPSRGAWFAPKIVVFSVAMESRGGTVKLDDITLSDGFGGNLLNNGGFSNGGAHWFSSSDKHHMPWHMKSLLFHTLFDQGVLGLAILLIMVFAAIFRLTVGKASSHPLAPPILAGICGFLIVGLFDSLIDAPRLAFLFYLLLLIAMTIRLPAQTQLLSRK